jgi:hypothetical protein
MAVSALPRVLVAPGSAAGWPPGGHLGWRPLDPAKRLLRRFRLWADSGYRPERHYMRGGRTAGAKSLAAPG